MKIDAISVGCGVFCLLLGIDTIQRTGDVWSRLLFAALYAVLVAYNFRKCFE